MTRKTVPSRQYNHPNHIMMFDPSTSIIGSPLPTAQNGNRQRKTLSRAEVLAIIDDALDLVAADPGLMQSGAEDNDRPN